MNTFPSKARYYDIFPFLRTASPSLQDAFFTQAAPVTLAPGQPICMEGTQCAHLPLVVSGTARVYKIGESGQEITLYRIEAGESCILTASCILSNRAFPAHAETETTVEAVIIPMAVFQTWFGDFPAWRNYIFSMLAERLAVVIELVEEVAFARLDTRLAAYLIHAAPSPDAVVERTHERIALDLGTSREVISRILKLFEQKGWIGLSRGAIRIHDADSLQEHTERL